MLRSHPVTGGGFLFVQEGVLLLCCGRNATFKSEATPLCSQADTMKDPPTQLLNVLLVTEEVVSRQKAPD